MFDNFGGAFDLFGGAKSPQTLPNLRLWR